MLSILSWPFFELPLIVFRKSCWVFFTVLFGLKINYSKHFNHHYFLVFCQLPTNSVKEFRVLIYFGYILSLARLPLKGHFETWYTFPKFEFCPKRQTFKRLKIIFKLISIEMSPLNSNVNIRLIRCFWLQIQIGKLSLNYTNA